jgi:hypothetical protein
MWIGRKMGRFCGGGRGGIFNNVGGESNGGFEAELISQFWDWFFCSKLWERKKRKKVSFYLWSLFQLLENVTG